MRPRSDSNVSLTGHSHERHDWEWILSQDEVWVDARRREHAIERMPEDYVANVIDFCHHYFDEDEFALPLDHMPLLLALRRRLEIAALQQALRTSAAQPERVAEPVVASVDNGAHAYGL